MTGKRPTLKEFLEAVETAETADEAAETLGCEPASIKARLGRLQKRYPHLNLKSFTSDGKGNFAVSENEAAAVLAQIRGVEVDEVITPDSE